MDYLQPFYESLAQGVQVAQHLNEASRQNAELDERKRSSLANEAVAGRHADIAEAAQRERQNQDRLTNQLSLAGSGAQPVAGDNTYGATMPALTGGANPDGSLASMPAPTRVGTAPEDNIVEYNGTRYRIPGADEMAKKELGRRVAQATALDQAKLGTYGVTLPDAITSEFGMPSGAKVLPEHARGLADLHEALNPKPAKDAAEKPPAYEGSTNDKGDVTPIVWNADKKKWEPGPVIKGAGKTKEPPAAGARAQTAQEKQSEAQAALHETYQQKEQDQWKLAQGYGNAAQSTDGTVIDPGNNKNEVTNSDVRRKYFQQQSDAAKTKALAYQNSAKQIRARYGWGEFAPGSATAGAQNAGAPATGAGATAAAPAATTPPTAAGTASSASAQGPGARGQGPKVATMDDVNRAVKATPGLTKAQALKAFQAKGWKIGTVQ